MSLERYDVADDAECVITDEHFYLVPDTLLASRLLLLC